MTHHAFAVFAKETSSSISDLVASVTSKFEKSKGQTAGASGAGKYEDQLKNIVEMGTTSALAKRVKVLDNLKIKNAKVATHFADKTLPLPQNFISVTGKGGSNAVVEDVYLMMGYGSWPCVDGEAQDGMGPCIYLKKQKKKVKMGPVVSIGATVRGNKVCEVIKNAFSHDVCGTFPSLKYAKLGLQASTAEAALNDGGLPQGITIPAAFGDADDFSFEKKARLFGAFDIPQSADCGNDPVCTVFKGLNAYVGVPSLEASVTSLGKGKGFEAALKLETAPKEKPTWIDVAQSPTFVFRRVEASVALTKEKTSTLFFNLRHGKLGSADGHVYRQMRHRRRR